MSRTNAKEPPLQNILYQKHVCIALDIDPRKWVNDKMLRGPHLLVIPNAMVGGPVMGWIASLLLLKKGPML